MPSYFQDTNCTYQKTIDFLIGADNREAQNTPVDNKILYLLIL